MSDEEVQSEEPEGVDVDSQEKAAGQTNDEAVSSSLKVKRYSLRSLQALLAS